MPCRMASVVIQALQLSKWLPSNTQTMKWLRFWWANMILLKLYMAFSHDEFHHPQPGEPRGGLKGLAPNQVNGVHRPQTYAQPLWFKWLPSHLCCFSFPAIPKTSHRIGLWVTWQIVYSHIAMKWCTQLDVAKERWPIVFQGHPSNFKVTQLKKSSNLTQIGRFRTATPVWVHQWLRNDAQSLK